MHPDSKPGIRVRASTNFYEAGVFGLDVRFPICRQAAPDTAFLVQWICCCADMVRFGSISLNPQGLIPNPKSIRKP